MRSIVVLLLGLAACKGGDDTETAKPETKPVTPRPTDVAAAEPLPGSFPLPETASRRLTRSSAKIAMTVWEYEYTDLDVPAAIKRLESALPEAGYTVTNKSTTGDTHTIFATHGGRSYAVGIRPHEGRTQVAIRSFPESGPTTLPAPSSYPTKFPFLAGGTASHAKDGAELRVAYQQDAKDVEIAMVLAAQSAGWECKGTGSVTCTKDKATVAFKTEAAPGGSLLVVSAR